MCGRPAHLTESALHLHLQRYLPNDWHILTNVTVRNGHQTRELDTIVIGDFFVWVLESKGFNGHLSGDQNGLYNPDGTLALAAPLEVAEGQQRFLGSCIKEVGLGVAVIGLIVLTNDKVTLNLKGGHPALARILLMNDIVGASSLHETAIGVKRSKTKLRTADKIALIRKIAGDPIADQATFKPSEPFPQPPSQAPSTRPPQANSTAKAEARPPQPQNTSAVPAPPRPASALPIPPPAPPPPLPARRPISITPTVNYPAPIPTGNEDPGFVCYLIDCSGSMECYKDAVIGNHRLLVEPLRKSRKARNGMVYVGQYLFNHQPRELHAFRKLDPGGAGDVVLLDKSNYKPSGRTALFQSIHKALQDLAAIIQTCEAEGYKPQIHLAVLTDGLDTEGGIEPGEILGALDPLRGDGYLSSAILVGLLGPDFDGDKLKRLALAMGFNEWIPVDGVIDMTEQAIRRAFHLMSEPAAMSFGKK
jgi:hypothetical protein